MVDLDRLKELAASNLSMAETARELGVTRARIGQLAGRHSIKFRKWNTHAPSAKTRRAQKTRPAPRILTGGAKVIVGHAVAGKVAEMLAAADLLARGWQVFLPIYSNRGHDIVACKGDAILTFEVRSAVRTRTGGLSYNRKADNKSAHYALVVTGEQVTYRPELPGCE